MLNQEVQRRPYCSPRWKEKSALWQEAVSCPSRVAQKGRRRRQVSACSARRPRTCVATWRGDCEAVSGVTEPSAVWSARWRWGALSPKPKRSLTGFKLENGMTWCSSWRTNRRGSNPQVLNRTGQKIRLWNPEVVSSFREKKQSWIHFLMKGFWDQTCMNVILFHVNWIKRKVDPNQR